MKKLFSKKLKRRAFTLVELLVSLAIIGIMLTIATEITVRLMRDSLKSDLRSEVDRNVNYAVETMKRNIIGSSAINLYNSSSTDPVSSCTVASPCIALSTNYKTNLFFKIDSSTNKLLQCAQLSCDNTSNPTNLVGNDVKVKNLSFQMGSGGFVQITFDAYDENNIVYPDTIGLKVITGAINRDSGL